jgi:transposase
MASQTTMANGNCVPQTHRIIAIESVGARVLFLPTYSPELNPIEMLWSKLKAFLRKLKPRTREDLDAAVSTFVTSLQQEDLLGYFIETEARTVFISKLQ